MSVYFTASGLAPYSVHALHIHQFGDLSDPICLSAGEHFNPFNEFHGGPNTDHRHAGDMGNVTADGLGVATLLRTFNLQSFQQHNASIIGHATILHALRDDGNPLHLWNSTGSAGGRIAGGVIGISARESPMLATYNPSDHSSEEASILRTNGQKHGARRTRARPTIARNRQSRTTTTTKRGAK
jgi:Cu-Zn family superoxide dismutase